MGRYVSNEVLEDSMIVASSLRAAFSAETAFMIEQASLPGLGAGHPLGIINASCKIAVAKENGQAPATILAENVCKMWAALSGPCRSRAVWMQ